MATRNGTAAPQGKPQGGGRNAPAHQVRVGRIQGTVWKNDGKDGAWYSVSITRSYQDGQKQWKQAATFGRDDLLVVAEVSRLCWLFIAQQNGSKLDGGGDNNEENGTSDIPF